MQTVVVPLSAKVGFPHNPKCGVRIQKSEVGIQKSD